MAPAVNTDGDLTMEGQQIEELLATEVAEKIEGKEETTEKEEDAHDDGEKVANGEDPIANGQLEPTVKQIADWSKCPAKGTEKCWNPRCSRSAVVDSTYKSRKVVELTRQVICISVVIYVMPAKGPDTA
ncbi:hypothetical protein FOZ63_032810, partial [Perkinsus olseni]